MKISSAQAAMGLVNHAHGSKLFPAFAAFSWKRCPRRWGMNTDGWRQRGLERDNGNKAMRNQISFMPLLMEQSLSTTPQN